MCHILSKNVLGVEKTSGFSFWAGKGRIFAQKKREGFKKFLRSFSGTKLVIASGVIFFTLF